MREIIINVHWQEYCWNSGKSAQLDLVREWMRHSIAALKRMINSKPFQGQSARSFSKWYAQVVLQFVSFLCFLVLKEWSALHCYRAHCIQCCKNTCPSEGQQKYQQHVSSQRTRDEIISFWFGTAWKSHTVQLYELESSPPFNISCLGTRIYFTRYCAVPTHLAS